MQGEEKKVRSSMLAPYLDLRRRLWSVYWFMQGDPRSVSAEISRALLRACIGRPDPTILEIGANVGQTTAWFLEVFEDATIYCFEPDPRAAARFEQKIGDHPRVKLFRVALSDRAGKGTFYQSSGHDPAGNADPLGWNQSGSLKKPTGHLEVHPWVTFENALEVETATLDDWCQAQRIGPIDLIWMDVQGAERDVLRGGARTAAKTRFLYTEYSNRQLYDGQPSLSDIRSELEDFSVVVRYPNDVLLRNRKLGPLRGSAYLRALMTYLR